MTLLLSMMASLSVMMTFIKHPMSMGITLIIQTFIISMILGLLLSNFFLSYIIMIIMLSGALVLFIYMASVASNEKFQTNISQTMFVIMMMLTLLAALNYKNELEIHIMNLMEKTEIMLLSKIFSYPSTMITIMAIIYLLFAMIVVSKNVNINEGPLRIKMYE